MSRSYKKILFVGYVVIRPKKTNNFIIDVFAIKIKWFWKIMTTIRFYKSIKEAEIVNGVGNAMAKYITFILKNDY